MLANILSRYWWMILLRGLAWLVFGILVFRQPAISLVTLTLLFGAFALVDGIANTVSAIGGRRENENWGVLLLTGLAGIAIGALTFYDPTITALGLLFYIAIWVTGTGLLQVVAGIRLRCLSQQLPGAHEVAGAERLQSRVEWIVSHDIQRTKCARNR